MTKKRLFLLLGLPFAVFLLVELGLRLFNPAQETPGLKVSFTNDIPGMARTVQWQEHPGGLRSENWEEGKVRILCLGSDNSNPLLQANKDSWWGVAAALMGNPAPAVGGMGFHRDNAATMVRRLAVVAPKLKPTVVVLSFGPGEILYRSLDYRIVPGSLQEPLEMKPGGWRGKVLDLSQIASHWRLRREAARMNEHFAKLQGENAIRDRYAAARTMWQKAPVISECPWLHDPADEIAESLREFAALAKKNHFTPVVLWEPWPQRPNMTAEQMATFHSVMVVRANGTDVPAKVDPAWVDNRMRAFRMRAQAVADGLGIMMVDAAAKLENSSGLFLDDTQWTDKGCHAVGEMMVQPLQNAVAHPPSNP